MAFRVPSFPSVIAVWRFGNAPPALPDVQSPAQLTPGRRSITPFSQPPAGTIIPGSMQVLLPRATDIRDNKAPAGPDLAECPVGSGRFYDVVFVDDIGAGFANEHRFAQLRGIATWPLPYPTVAPAQGIAASWRASGGSAGAVVPNLFFTVAVPSPGLLFIVVAGYNALGLPPTTNCNGVGGLAPFNSAPAAAFGVTVETSISPFAVNPGYLSCGIRPGPGAGIIQYQVLFASGLYSNVADNGIAAVGAGMPFLPGAVGQVYADEIYPAPFGQINSAGPFGYGLGYTSTGGDVTDVIGGVPCTLSLGYLISSALGLYPVNMPLAVAGAWSGMSQGWK